eukprot:CAMPEP_0114253266 /NCGR_PEP_ID=MMETSP0058-20121206/16293_1 /TAXON_ID=36894 /ORGANISM="Pyramimonas parkeae, CCMP726" /LENGTH=658 /DNA_ID=CAMNT_0001367285 /DNA_START=393 /DNA_END=2369 /DNA_ORIENTATION=-
MNSTGNPAFNIIVEEALKCSPPGKHRALGSIPLCSSSSSSSICSISSSSGVRPLSPRSDDRHANTTESASRAASTLLDQCNSHSGPGVMPHGQVLPSFRTRLCKYYSSRAPCAHGDRCQFAHGVSELRVEAAIFQGCLPPGFKTRLCNNFLTRGQCPHTDCCHFAHGVEELRIEAAIQQGYLPPSFKTKLCHFFTVEGFCSHCDRCHFAHGLGELRVDAAIIQGVLPPTFKTRLCSFFATRGQCPRGDFCHFAHGDAELRQESSVLPCPLLTSRHPPAPVQTNGVLAPGEVLTSSTFHEDAMSLHPGLCMSPGAECGFVQASLSNRKMVQMASVPQTSIAEHASRNINPHAMAKTACTPMHSCIPAFSLTSTPHQSTPTSTTPKMSSVTSAESDHIQHQSLSAHILQLQADAYVSYMTATSKERPNSDLSAWSTPQQYPSQPFARNESHTGYMRNLQVGGEGHKAGALQGLGNGSTAELGWPGAGLNRGAEIWRGLQQSCLGGSSFVHAQNLHDMFGVSAHSSTNAAQFQNAPLGGCAEYDFSSMPSTRNTTADSTAVFSSHSGPTPGPFSTAAGCQSDHLAPRASVYYPAVPGQSFHPPPATSLPPPMFPSQFGQGMQKPVQTGGSEVHAVTQKPSKNLTHDEITSVLQNLTLSPAR